MYKIHMKTEFTWKINYIFMKNSFKSKNTSFYFIMSMKYMYLYVRNLQVHLYNI